MNVKILPSKICGTVTAPPSKSYAHRMLIAAFLCGKRVRVNGAGSSVDVQATMGALKALGASLVTTGNATEIEQQAVPAKATVDCVESGSTLRFLLPVAAALGVNATFTGSDRLLSRPTSELVCALNANGADINGFTVNGRLRAGEYVIPATLSSQYITGLLFALPLLQGDSTIVLQGTPVSTAYVDITLDVLARFGISVQKTDFGYSIKGGQKYTAPTDEITVEGDYSGAAFMLTLGAIGGNVTVNGLNAHSLQGDAQILDVLKSFGAKVTATLNSVSVQRQTLNAIELDCQNIPDLVQIISVAASYADGVTVLKNVERLRLKESDRISAITAQLGAAGIKCECANNNLIIYGGKPQGGILSGGGDHRTAMSAAVLALCSGGQSTVLGAEAVSKSYPHFFDDIKKIGGQIHVDV